MNNFMSMFSQKMNLPIHYSNRILLHLNKQLKQTILVYCHYMLLKTYLKTIDIPMKVFNPCS
jgi:hypothetical protein